MKKKKGRSLQSTKDSQKRAFKAAAVAKGLAHSDHQWIQVIRLRTMLQLCLILMCTFSQIHNCRIKSREKVRGKFKHNQELETRFRIRIFHSTHEHARDELS